MNVGAGWNGLSVSLVKSCIAREVKICGVSPGISLAALGSGGTCGEGADRTGFVYLTSLVLDGC